MLKKIYFAFPFICYALISNFVTAPPNVGESSNRLKSYDSTFKEKKCEFYSTLKALNQAKEDQTPYSVPTCSDKEIFIKSYQILNDVGDKIPVNIISSETEKEWFTTLTKSMFNPIHMLFRHTKNGKAIEIYPNSGVPDRIQLPLFEFIGKTVAWAIYKEHPIDALRRAVLLIIFVHLSRIFLKSIIDEPIRMMDIELVDLKFYERLLKIKSKTHYYKANYDSDRRKVRIMNDPITSLIEEKYILPVKKYMESFLKRFNEIIPMDLIKNFKSNELELLICGIPDIDVKEWRAHTIMTTGLEQERFLSESKWIWEVFESFNSADRAKLLYYFNGTSRLPFGKNLTIHFDNKLPYNSLPIFCIRSQELWLPWYRDKKTLKKELRKAMNLYDEKNNK